MALSTDKIDLKIGTDGDLELSATDLQFTSGVEAVAQGIRIRLRTFRNEWFLNLDTGVDWFGSILGQKYNATRVRSEIRDVILDTENDIEITRLDVDYNGQTREVTIGWEVRTTFGDLSDSLEFTI